MTPEAANAAAVGGAFAPMLTLGIPGDAVTAVIIGALYIDGLQPGPLLLAQPPDLFWFLVGALALANLFLLVFRLTGIRVFTRIVACPKAVLLPLLVVLSAVGAYAIQNNPTDVSWMLGLGVLGYLQEALRLPVAPAILGVILGPMMDANYRRATIGACGDPVAFLEGFVAHPISLALTAGFLAMLLSQTPLWPRRTARRP